MSNRFGYLGDGHTSSTALICRLSALTVAYAETTCAPSKPRGRNALRVSMINGTTR